MKTITINKFDFLASFGALLFVVFFLSVILILAGEEARKAHEKTFNYEREIAKYKLEMMEKNAQISSLFIHNKLLNITAPTSIYQTGENTYQSFVNKDGLIIVTNFFVDSNGNISRYSVE